MSEESAKLVESMMDEKPWADQPWARAALAIAARAIRRGRLLTYSEKNINLAIAFEEEGDFKTAATIRKIAGAAVSRPDREP